MSEMTPRIEALTEHLRLEVLDMERWERLGSAEFYESAKRGAYKLALQLHEAHIDDLQRAKAAECTARVEDAQVLELAHALGVDIGTALRVMVALGCRMMEHTTLASLAVPMDRIRWLEHFAEMRGASPDELVTQWIDEQRAKWTAVAPVAKRKAVQG